MSYLRDLIEALQIAFNAYRTVRRLQAGHDPDHLPF